MNKLILTIFFVTSLACSNTKKIMNAWVGLTKQQLILSWGPPSRIASDGGNGEILVYANQLYSPGVNGTGAFSYLNYKYMYVDSSSKIYHWLVKIEQIPPTQVDINVKRQ